MDPKTFLSKLPLFLILSMVLCGLCMNLAIAQEKSPIRSMMEYRPTPASHYRNNKVGFIHGVQYWVNPDATEESIDEDFKHMAEEDQINGARLAFWTIPLGANFDYTRFDACFRSAARHGVKINPVLPQIPGWLNGGADDPDIRKAYKEQIQKVISRYKDEPALAMWTVDIEPSRSWKVNPGEATLSLYRKWLPRRYRTLEDYRRLNPGQEAYDKAFAMNARNKGGWNNFQGFNDWITFTAWALAEQVGFVAEAVKEVDPIHPISCTPPDVLHNQVVENGRNMWWLADAVDYPGCQLHSHWHLETADMPTDVLIAQAASIRKVYCSARGRAASYSGEVLCGPDFGESTRITSPSAKELLGTVLTHLAEGSKGYYFWLWNPLRDGPNAGAWTFREVDGSPSDKSRLLSNFGRMVRQHNDLLCSLKPSDTPVAIFDSMDAAIYLHRRSHYHAMSEWFVKNQYGFYKALRKSQIGCDFLDEIGLLNDKAKDYACIYVPFSMCMTPEVATALREYVAEGGTLIADAMTAFTPPNHLQYSEQPGAGLQEVFGIKASGIEVAYSGWTDVLKTNHERHFDRIQTAEPDEQAPIFNARGRRTPLVASRFLQFVQPITTTVTHQDEEGRPVCTVNKFGKGYAIWTGTLLGMTCRAADTPPERYEAVANFIRPYMPETPWKFQAPKNTIVCRRLTGQGQDLFVLFNEGFQDARFTLDLGRKVKAKELLYPNQPPWKQVSKHKIKGHLGKMEGSVIYVPVDR